MDLVEWETYLDKVTGTKRDLGTISLLIDGENFFPLFRRRMEEAEESVYLRVCIFDNDDVAVGVADLLKRISGDVKVRVLADRLSTQTAARALPTRLPEGFTQPKSMPRYMRRDSRVKVRAFLNPWLSPLHVWARRDCLPSTARFLRCPERQAWIWSSGKPTWTR